MEIIDKVLNDVQILQSHVVRFTENERHLKLNFSQFKWLCIGQVI